MLSMEHDAIHRPRHRAPAPRSTWAPSSAPACCSCPRSRRRPPGRRRCWPGPGCWRPRWPSRRPSPPSACATPSPAARRRTCAPPSAAAPAAVTGWWFYAGVVGGAPAVWLIGGFYVAHLTGGGRAVGGGGGRRDDGRRAWRPTPAACTRPRACSSASPRCSPCCCSSPSSSALPSAARGQLDAVRAARLAGDRHRGEPADALLRRLGGGRAPRRRLRDPRRQLPRAMLAAFAIVAVLYLGLAVTTVAVLGGAPGSTVPLADLMQRGLGGAGERAHRGRRRPAHGRHDERLRRRRHAPGRGAGGRRLDAARGWRGPARRWPSSPRRARRSSAALAAGLVDVDPIVRAISTCLRRGLRRRHRGRGAAARRAPARGGGALAGAGRSSCSPSRAPTSPRRRRSRCWRAPSSVPVRVAQLGGELQPHLVVVQRADRFGCGPGEPANAGSAG